MGVPTSTPTKVAYGVVFLAVSIALYGVYTGQDVKQVAIPAFQWSQTHAHALLARYVFRTNASNVRQHRSILGTFVCWMHPRIGTQPAAADGKIPQASTQHTEAFEPAACQLHGPVVDCACTYAAVERVNHDSLWPVLEELVQLPFFRYFKVNLYCQCPLWPDEGQCAMRDCCVDACKEEEIPAPWREDERRRKEAFAQQCGQGEGEGGLDRSVEGSVKAKLQAVRNWHGLNNPWVPADAEHDVEYEYINLRANPEKYTGYKGEDARRIWAAIYAQSCFEDIHAEDTCTERQVFYRLISGMHSSITTHIIDNFYDDATGTWGSNLKMFKWRFGNPEARPYVENLYFAYLFVLRAVIKATPVLTKFDFNTGMAAMDARTKELISKLVSNSALRQACPTPFDEGRLWKSQDTMELKEQLQTHFHNITRIMDCVGCDKCKMWGKLQILGIATSLKVLFEEGHTVEFDRNEVIALVNLLGRLSESVETIRRLSVELRAQEQKEQTAQKAQGEQEYGAIKGLTGGEDKEIS